MSEDKPPPVVTVTERGEPNPARIVEVLARIAARRKEQRPAA